MSSILAEVTCNIGDSIWMMENDEIVQKTISDLYKLNIIDKKDVCYTTVKRLKYSYVINDTNYNENLNIISKYMQTVDIDLVGRFAEFKYLNMDGCIRRALDYAHNW
jgi:protoporphyrinogen oxidase